MDALTTNSDKSLVACRPTPVADLVRVGRNNDGGYVIPKRLCDASEVLVGLGISSDWSFETAFVVRNPQVTVVAVDGSVSAEIFRNRARSVAWEAARLALGGRLRDARARVSGSRELFRLARVFAGFFQGSNRFIQKFLADSDAGRCISWGTLKEIVTAQMNGRELRNVFVKMDIEGAEYRVLAEVLRDADMVAGMAIEFHDCDLLWERFTELIALIRRDFVIVHVHGNNCTPLISGTTIPRTLEISIMHRSLLTEHDRWEQSERAYPLSSLDQPNDPTKADYPLDFGLPVVERAAWAGV